LGNIADNHKYIYILSFENIEIK